MPSDQAGLYHSREMLALCPEFDERRVKKDENWGECDAKNA